MSDVQFTTELCEQIFAMPKKLVSSIRWHPEGSVFKFRAKVLAPAGIALDLFGVWNKISRHGETRWQFSLKYCGYCIRSFDMARKHKNPGERWVKGPHKHKFQSARIDRFAYKPEPAISVEDPNQSLMDFLAEANIELPTDYQRMMFF